MMVVPLTDASRRPTSFPLVTAVIIGVNALVFVLELAGGDAFVERWSVIPADIVAGRHWITILTAMFMHAGWSHIIGNIGVWGLLQLLSLGALVEHPASGGVAYAAHVGGFIFGAVAARLFARGALYPGASRPL